VTIWFGDSLKSGWPSFDPGDDESRGLEARVGEQSHDFDSLVLVVRGAVLVKWSAVDEVTVSVSA
jgi:hypothetical protein